MFFKALADMAKAENYNVLRSDFLNVKLHKYTNKLFIHYNQFIPSPQEKILLLKNLFDAMPDDERWELSIQGAWEYSNGSIIFYGSASFPRPGWPREFFPDGPHPIGAYDSYPWGGVLKKGLMSDDQVSRWEDLVEEESGVRLEVIFNHDFIWDKFCRRPKYC